MSRELSNNDAPRFIDGLATRVNTLQFHDGERIFVDPQKHGSVIGERELVHRLLQSMDDEMRKDILDDYCNHCGRHRSYECSEHGA
jgi:hypothetical protein